MDILTALVIGASCGFCGCAWLARSDRLPGAFTEGKVEGLSADLDSAVEVAFKRGAKEWTRLNYPDHFKRLSAKPA